MTSRSDLSRLVPLDGPVAAKSFVLEVHTDDPVAYLGEIAGVHNVEDTDDAFLTRVIAPSFGEFWVDRLDPRFWTFHTTMRSVDAAAWLTRQVALRRDTDWMWLPSAHLRNVAPDAVPRKVRTDFDGDRLVSADDAALELKVQVSGAHAERLLDTIADLPDYKSSVSFNSIEVDLDDPDLGALRESVRRWGAFAAHGDDFAHHAQFVQLVIGRYARLVESIEQLALRFDPLGDSDRGDIDEHHAALDSYEAVDPDYRGSSFRGMPIGIHFSRSINDMPRFCEELFSSRAPFRLWGRPVITRGIAEVQAVDLHVGERLQMEIGREWMRLYLHGGCCGNTVARLVSNLQSRFDSALLLSRPEIEHAATTSDGS